MQTIYKYPLRIKDAFSIHIHQGATPLSVQMQSATPCLWALVDPDAPMEYRAVACRGTGHPANGVRPEDFIGTVQIHGGSLVFHFFMKQGA